MTTKSQLKSKLMVGLVALSLGVSTPSYAIFGDGGAGWAQLPYLIQILSENIKRYQQLKNMIGDAKRHRRWLKDIHQGLENASGLLESLPVKDEKILSQLRSFNKSVRTIEEIYGEIPKSKEEVVQRLHDNTVAESLRMIHDFQKYAEKQESNAIVLSSNSRSASPKGAARIAATTNAEILNSLSQLIRLNSQMLKLQGENLALSNKLGKSQVVSYQKVNTTLEKNFKGFKPNMRLPKF